MCGAGRMSLNDPAQPMRRKGESVSYAASIGQSPQSVDAPREFSPHPEGGKQGCSHKPGLRGEAALAQVPFFFFFSKLKTYLKSWARANVSDY